ncbi:MAG: carboxypeptidase-like regulatory domain-containing protein, partial [Candidatus Paceibacterota bacterium]
MNGIKLRKKALILPCVNNSYFSSTSVKKSTSFLFKTFLIAIFTVAFGISDSYAQDRVEITGVVTDAADGSPLPGASIVVLESDEVTGTMIGTTSGMDGSYSISVPPSLNVFRVTFIGYIPQNVTIDGRTEVNIALQQDIRLLDDVVVVGYGVQDKREITSAVATVDLEQFNKGNISDASQLLQGKVAGLIVNNRGGNPNRSSTLRL